MEKPTCKTCIHRYADKKCHRYAPGRAISVVHLGYDHAPNEYNPYIENSWQYVGEDDGCGEHPDFPAYLQSLESETPLEKDDQPFVRCSSCGTSTHWSTPDGRSIEDTALCIPCLATGESVPKKKS